MNERKKFLTFIFTLFCCIIFSTACYAESDLYLTTTPCPDAYKEYAEEHLLDFVSSMDDIIVTDYANISVGNPFNFGNENSDIYYFPVLNDGELILLFRVYPDENGYAGAMSRFLVDELTELASETSANEPLTLIMDGADIVACIGTETQTLFSYPEVLSSNNTAINTAANSIENIADKIVVDIMENSDIELTQSVAPFSTNAGSKYLALTIKDTQGSTSWCAAYSTDMILRYIGAVPSSHSYQTIVNYFGLSSDEALTNTQVRAYAMGKGVNSALMYSTVGAVSTTRDILINEIDNSRPVFISMLNLNKGTGHAVVLRGYHLLADIYSIWNPWYNYFESYTIGGTYVPTTNATVSYEMRGYMKPWILNN